MSNEKQTIAGIAALFFGFFVISQQATGALPVGLTIMAVGFYFILKNIS